MAQRPFTIYAIIGVQALSAGLIVFDVVATVFGLRSRPVSWQTREILELLAAVGLISGLIVGAFFIRRAEAERAQASQQLRIARGAFAEVIEERFTDWALTPAERDVALFALKGMSLQEIADLRSTSEGTVKAQTNAIYRKAGVSGRTQLLSLFVDELL